MAEKLKVGILGATGMVGQRFITLLDEHPWFDVVALAASKNSAGKTYGEVIDGRWKLDVPMPGFVKDMVIYDMETQMDDIASMVDFVFCAVNMPADEVKILEEKYAKAEVPVVSNNSANRWTEDIPMVVPEINPEHLEIIEAQKRRLGTTRGFICVKPNCSIQAYTPALNALKEFSPKLVVVSTYQAISGAGKTFDTWPEMVGNVIPFISGEEEKSEREPLRLWGKVSQGKIIPATEPVITAQCVRVPVLNGHTATVSVNFEKKPTKEQIIEKWRSFEGISQQLNLPSAPAKFMQYLDEDDRPQVKLDVDYENGMGVSLGRLREDTVFDYKFVGLAHNTLRGAAGGAVLIAELLKAKGYIEPRPELHG